ncbi:MAG: class I SAM-dependent methyltransferase [Pseudomonadota bacterium]
MAAVYDEIGVDYADLRKPDPQIAAAITDALGSAESVINIGAGAGSYEPSDRRVTAVEPSIEMIRQRDPAAAKAVQGHAENLPFADDSFGAAMAILTVHHWTDKAKGMAEMRRVSRGPVVLLTFDPEHPGCWLTDYIPELVELDERQMPKMADYEKWLGSAEIRAVPIPHDCTDGFLYAYWRRPRAYLDPRIRKAISSFWVIEGIEERLEQLARDLDSGAWEQRYSDLLERDAIDAGYRLVVAR